MSRTATLLDAKTDILRCITSTYSKAGLNDKNFKYFLKSAITIFDKLNLEKEKKELVSLQIRKTKYPKKDINRIREDLLLITSLI